jgi:hypothetical protein
MKLCLACPHTLFTIGIGENNKSHRCDRVAGRRGDYRVFATAMPRKAAA